MRLFLIFILLCNTAMAQGFNPYFTKIGTEKGLSHKKINCIIQDKRGFMWFGTEDGLNRYDGRYFTVFRSEPNVTSCLSGNIVSDIYEDKQGLLWIATADGGMTKYDYRQPPSKQFRQFKHDRKNPEGIPENGINKITEDNQGNLWLATSGSYAVRFNKKTEKFGPALNEKDMGTRGILSFESDRNDILWVGRIGGGLLKINTRTLAYKEDRRYHNLYANLPHNTVTSIFKDKTNAFWLGSWDNKVYRYSPDRLDIGVSPEEAPAGVPADEMASFAEDNSNRIWMAGKNTGITVYNRLTRQVYHFRHNPYVEGTLTNDHANVVYIDRSGIVWVGTDNGLNKYNPLFSPFVQYPLKKRDDNNVIVYDFYKDEQQKLWIGTSDGIVTKENNSQVLDYRNVMYKGQKLAVTKFFIDQDKTFYIGTDYTLFKYDPATNTVIPLPHTDEDPVMKKLFSSRIVSIVRDTINNHPVLLVSPYGHYLAYYDLRESKWVSRTDSVQQILKRYDIKDNLIRKFYADRNGNILIATNKFGLGDWQRGGISPIKYYSSGIMDKNSISSDNIFDIYQNREGNFWISTYGGGLNYFDKGTDKFTHIRSSSNLTEGIASDDEDDLWMLCNGHVNKYEIKSKLYSSYELPFLQSSEGLMGYIYKDNENNLYAAGVNYYITFNPGKIAKIPPNPEVFLTDFKIFNKSFSHWLDHKTIVLNYFQNFFSIEFSAPEYTGDNVSYSYMLEGVDKSWIQAGKHNSANYTNLAGGKYRFKVKATNWNDTEVSNYKSIIIIITPPFWLRWWFSSIIVIIISTIAYFFYRYRVNTLLEQQAIRNGIAQDLHDQIGSTLSSISVYSEVAKIYQGQDKATQLNNILETISHTANEMINDMADIVWAINPKNDNLNSIMVRIENFARPLCKVKNINFTFRHVAKSQANIAATWIRKNLYLILKETINNAIKHADCANLDVEVRVVDDMLYARIKDDGIGFVSNADFSYDATGSLGGNGMTNIRLRAEELKAKLVIDSNPGSGTVIQLSVRIK
ncbi:ligand-binding sensor domain-containing protein [Pedobacter hartonius]|uniref:Two component regulator propeller n=1 Tax=Pedobacter hartonius TaxID=425514 RepID=A0A1H4E1A9_9SPHI|nr:sensor histidine kinase [Pedobacter hartonius]SEA78706.1 Two component regulator propeller [Pedobacter hartonius]